MLIRLGIRDLNKDERDTLYMALRAALDTLTCDQNENCRTCNNHKVCHGIGQAIGYLESEPNK